MPKNIKIIFASICCLMLSCLATVQAAAPAKITTSGPEHRTELWEGKVLTATFRAGMCFAPNGQAQGVLLLRHANGNEDTYHLYGTINNGNFDLSHSSGHIFNGSITGAHSMEGKVKLGNGMRFSLKGTRKVDVPLMAEDCAPLPEPTNR